MLKPGLYLIGTPIGHLADLTLRAIEILGGVDFILAEDTRHTRILLDRHQIKKANLISCHKFNEQSRGDFVLEQIQSGKAVALVTNAGMPAVADPGARIVRACRQAGLYVTVIPGPSAVTAALALSGFGGHGFVCAGFLPRKKGQRLKRLSRLKDLDMAAVIFESPFRCLALLDELKEVFADREIFLGRELTKINEQCLWGTAAEIKRFFCERDLKQGERAVKGELTFVIAPVGREGQIRDQG
jgi:16S rRNA (cytidine1402-2'-O)-methyltransferase